MLHTHMPVFFVQASFIHATQPNQMKTISTTSQFPCSETHGQLATPKSPDVLVGFPGLSFKFPIDYMKQGHLV